MHSMQSYLKSPISFIRSNHYILFPKTKPKYKSWRVIKTTWEIFIKYEIKGRILNKQIVDGKLEIFAILIQFNAKLFYQTSGVWSSLDDHLTKTGY